MDQGFWIAITRRLSAAQRRKYNVCGAGLIAEYKTAIKLARDLHNRVKDEQAAGLRSVRDVVVFYRSVDGAMNTSTYCYHPHKRN